MEEGLEETALSKELETSALKVGQIKQAMTLTIKLSTLRPFKIKT